MFGFEECQRYDIIVAGDAGIGTLSAVWNAGLCLVSSLCTAGRRQEKTQNSEARGSTCCLQTHAHSFSRQLPVVAMLAEPGSPVDALPASLVKLECVDFVHYLDVCNAARAMADITGLDF